MTIVRYRFEFKIQDMWIGFYWKVDRYHTTNAFCYVNIWICLIPCVPLHIVVWKLLP